MPFNEENLIISFGLYTYNSRSEDVWKNIDTNPTSVVCALESFCDLDPHYFQTNIDKDDDGGGIEMGSTQSDDDSNGGHGSECDSKYDEGGDTAPPQDPIEQL
eukprot:scaffold119833_cov77-Cyclotella_meneghiniana.AAC.1